MVRVVDVERVARIDVQGRAHRPDDAVVLQRRQAGRRVDGGGERDVQGAVGAVELRRILNLLALGARQPWDGRDDAEGGGEKSRADERGARSSLQGVPPDAERTKVA